MTNLGKRSKAALVATLPKAVQLPPPLVEYCQLPRPVAVSMAMPRVAASMSLPRLASRLPAVTAAEAAASSVMPLKV